MSACDGIAKDVISAIQRDVSKTLLIVEDALVINESCAGDIVRAAIIASRADAAMVNQIVQTSIGVAPKMAAVITDSANATAPGALAATGNGNAPVPTGVVAEGDKNPVEVVVDKNPVPVIDKNPVPVVVKETVTEESSGYSSFRGIYLIQPPPVGYPPCDIPRKCDHIPTSPCGCVAMPGKKTTVGSYAVK
jgi:hypothetical protein